MVTTVVDDERQLDGSRHLEIVGDDEHADAALRLVISRDGTLQEAELSLELDGEYTVIGFEPDANVVLDEVLEVDLVADDGRAEIQQRDDGDLDLTLTLGGDREREE
ncbi:MAG: hypothetical protein OXN86_10900 [Chloroflexota bacterium]|nr:hypothetical protein [Chloroflexota bacterium]